jgi:hypothetical protein
VGVAPDAIGWWVVQIFYHVNFNKFIQLLLEWGKCNYCHTPNTLRATPATTGDQREQHNQQIALEARNMNRKSAKQILNSQRERWIHQD